MASCSRDLMKFEEAITYMKPLEVTDYLQKTLNFLKQNISELCFPNIPPHTEVFLVNLASDNRNLKSKCLKNESKALAKEIIEVLETSKDVFRWTYAFVNGTVNKDILVYKKIYNKAVMNHGAVRKKISSKANRLPKPKSESTDVPTTRKIELLNMTLKFIKDRRLKVLDYPEMPVNESEYLYKLVDDPRGDPNVGFAFKNLKYRLYEVLDEQGEGNELKISYVAKADSDKPCLRLEKRPKTQRDSDLEASLQKEENKEDSPLDNLQDHCKQNQKSSSKPEPQAPVSKQFIEDTLRKVLTFTNPSESKSTAIRFADLTAAEAAFVNALRNFAQSPSPPKMCRSHRELLKRIDQYLKQIKNTVKFKREITKSGDDRYTIVLKKELLQGPPPSAENVLENVGAETVKPPPKNNPTSSTVDKENTTDNANEAKRTDGLCRRKAKLLEDLAVPVDSEIGSRMMRLMGWDGGALGLRGEGILEPIVPAIERASHAGLGHNNPQKITKKVKSARPSHPPRRSAFHLMFLEGVHSLLLSRKNERVLVFSTKLNVKNVNFMSNAMLCLNNRQRVKGRSQEEVAKINVIMEWLCKNGNFCICVKVSEDFFKVSLNKVRMTAAEFQNILSTPIELPVPIRPMTIQGCIRERYDVISQAIVKNVGQLIDTSCDTPETVDARAMRVLLLSRFIDIVKGDLLEREFRFESPITKKLKQFLRDVVKCLPASVSKRSVLVDDEEIMIYDELKERARGWNVTLDFLDKTSFILKKVKMTSHIPKIDFQYDNNNENETKDDSEDDNEQKQGNATETNEIKNNNNKSQDTEDDREKKNNTDANEKDNPNIKKTLVAVDSLNNNEDEIDNGDIVNKNNDDTIIPKASSSAKDVTETAVEICDKKIDDKDNVNKAKIDLNTIREDSEPGNSKRSRPVTSYGCSNLPSADPKKTKLDVNEKLLIISPKDVSLKMNPEIVKNIQVLISNEIDKCVDFLPLLKCHGLRDNGVVYSCCDESGVAWLKNAVQTWQHPNLDLIISECIGKDSYSENCHKMVITLNSFINLDAVNLFKSFERYHDVLDTTEWKVLGKEICESSIMFIVEIDEISLSYISAKDFSLYCGIDKAHFSIIY